MKCAIIVLVLALVSLGVNAQRPLQMVHPDSVLLDDFFWLPKVDSACVLYPGMKSPETGVTMKDMAGLSGLKTRFDKLEAGISITGSARDLSDNIRRFRSARDMAFLAFRLALMTRQGRYFDFCERALFNEIAGAWVDPVSKVRRKEVAEALSAVPGMLYAVDGHDVYINMLVRNIAHIVAEDLDFRVRLMVSMPWYSQCMFAFEMDREQEFTLHIRLPHWAEGQVELSSYDASSTRSRIDVYVNGDRVDKNIVDGYYVIRRRWKKGDVIKYVIPSPVIRVSDRQQSSGMALQRGPLVYAFENACSVRRSDGVSNTFDHDRTTIFLTSKQYDEQGMPIGQYKAFPYFWSPEKYGSLLFSRMLK